MVKRSAYVHIGLPHSGAERIDAAIHLHADALAASGVTVPAQSVDETFRAAVELRREHKSWGLRRKDVEGVWSGICRRALKGRGDVLVGHHLLAGSTPAEIDLLVDRLPGFAIHVVVTVAAPDARLSAFPDDHDLADVLARWDRAVASPDRMHVIVCDPADPTDAWEALGQITGFEGAGLDVPAATERLDTRALRVIADNVSSLAGREDLVEVVEQWAKVVADQGYDVRGDLTAMVAATTAAAVTASSNDDLTITALSDALSDTLAEVARLRARAVDLERTNAKLTNKKRSLKRKLMEATAASAG